MRTSLVPELDTIDFERLVEAARGLIPRFAPEWTDHNVHDPGMTIVDLLAWIVDQQVYRLGFVSDRHLRGFAALLGTRAAGPEAATGAVWPVEDVPVGATLERGTRIGCIDEPQLDFALAATTQLTTARLVDVVLLGDGEPVHLDGHRGERPAVTVGPIAPGAPAAMVLRFDGPLVRTVGEPISVGFEVEPPPGEPPGSDHPWGPLVFDHRVGGGPWRFVEVLEDGTAALSRTGAVSLVVTGTAEPGPSELRARLDRGRFPVAARLRHVAVNVLPVVQWRVDPPHPAAGVGTGLPDQLVELDTSDLVAGSPLVVHVGGARWHERTELSGSGPDDEVFVRLPDGIGFGNGVNGKRPPLGAPIGHGELVRTGGDAGNLRSGLRWQLPASAGGPGALATNRAPTSGGRSATTTEALVRQARLTATTRRVLLTDDDLVRAALRLPGLPVGRAEVLAGHHPALPGRFVAGTRTLVVIPHRRAEEPPAGVPTAYLDEVRRALEARRVLGEQLHVRGPRLVPVDVAVTLVAEAGVDIPALGGAVRGRIGARLSDLARDDEIAAWPLGRPVTAEELVALAATVPGVAVVLDCRAARAGSDGPARCIGLEPDEVAVAAAVEVEVLRQADGGGGALR